MASKAGQRLHRLDRISHTALSNLDKSKTAVVASMSPLEVHGPHLPLGQDLMEAYAFAENSMKLFLEKNPDWNVVLLPPVPVATDCVPMLGSVNFPVHLVRDVAYYLLEPFARQGFARLAISSFHGGPRHICALEDAAGALYEKYNVPTVSLFSAVISQITEGDVFMDALSQIEDVQVTTEHMRQDHHAGFVEPSLALVLWPELVEDGWEDLPTCVSDPDTQKKLVAYKQGMTKAAREKDKKLQGSK